MAWRIKGGIKWRETDPTSNQFPKCPPQPGTPREVHSYMEKRRGRRETEVARRRKGGNQEDRDRSRQYSVP